jgi:hypothetical protein
MRLHLNDTQVNLILYCLEQQAYEFNDKEKEDYNAILHSIEIAQSFEYDF